MNFEIQITGTSTAGRLFTLARQPDQLAIRHARRDRDTNRVGLQLQGPLRFEVRALQLQRSCRAREGLLEVDVDARMVIARSATARAPEVTIAPAREATASEQGRKEVTEAFGFLELLGVRATSGT